MNDGAADIATGRDDAVASANVDHEWWAQESQRQQSEAERWQRRVDLAERHQEFDLATEAAHRARYHAGLALEARLAQLDSERDIEARLAAIKAAMPTPPAPVQRGGR
jgi:phage shock protein A